jgi:hypothetical protein
MLIGFPLDTNELQCRKTSLRNIEPLIANFTVETLPGVVGRWFGQIVGYASFGNADVVLGQGYLP